MATFETLCFDNAVLRTLPIDDIKENFVRRVRGACFSLISPTPVKKPKLVAFSRSAMGLLDLGDEEMKRADAAVYFSGNCLLFGSVTAAHCYCGHQFGRFAGQLGDGAAVYLGEIINQSGQRWEIQLKGAGRTPYSRTADGRKVLRSSVREFLCSEAMHHLGIPTTRAGTCVTSDTMVPRDNLYNGNVINERATVILRIAPTFIRFGSFEIVKPEDASTGREGPSVGNKDILVALLDYVVSSFFPDICSEYEYGSEDRYLEFFKEVVRVTARLVALWQCVGFTHGVINTDNMSVIGLTIDYGPFGFMDHYYPDYVPNKTDSAGFYAYIKQPERCRWNLEKLAEALALVLPVERSKAELKLFDTEFEKCYTEKMKLKFGLLYHQSDEDSDLFESFFETMHQTGSDFTNSFRCLSRFPLPGAANEEQAKLDVLDYLVSQCSKRQDLLKRSSVNMEQRQLTMLMDLGRANPLVLSLLGVSMEQLQREVEMQEQRQQLEVMGDEEKEASDRQHWSKWLDQYSERLSKELEALYEMTIQELQDRRISVMNSNNPRFILRTYLAQNAIKLAEDGDFSEVSRLLRLLESPFSDEAHIDSRVGENLFTQPSSQASGASSSACASSQVQLYDSKPPVWAHDIQVT
ncbi:protein adenylyltransferase SelO, mitochondrial-like [Corticium candelabrum]|uniref:protein adenylyltransferase SelO, mitochondrial-like n=1 Tax=Corticium candelabrum TaxID=121492 RepID=UPI002E26BB73|nr:protein adenylyltransferase SelO, mitochondrial-like [Corticium candelabrum]